MKRTISLLIAALMILSLMPDAVFAGNDYSDISQDMWTIVGSKDGLVTALEQEGTAYIKLSKDISWDHTYSWKDGGNVDVYEIEVAGTKVLDLAGHTIKCYMSEKNSVGKYVGNKTTLIKVGMGADLTVTDSGFGGEIRYTGAMSDYSCTNGNPQYIAYDMKDIFGVTDGGKLTVNGGYINGGNSTKQYICWCKNNETGKRYDGKVTQQVWGSAVRVERGGLFIASGGSFEGQGEGEYGYNTARFNDQCIDISAGGKAIINDGFFFGKGGADVFRVAEGAELTVKSGTFQTESIDKIRIPDYEKDTTAVGGRYFSGSKGKIGFPKSALTNAVADQDNHPAGDYNPDSSDRLDVVPAMKSLNLEFEGTKSTSIDYALGASGAITYDGVPGNFDTDALDMCAGGSYTVSYEWKVWGADNTVIYKMTTDEPRAELSVLMAGAGMKEGSSCRISAVCKELWYSAHNYKIETGTPGNYKVNVLPAIKGSFGWTDRPRVGEKARVYADVEGASVLTYTWKMSVNNEWKTVATTSVPEYVFTEDYLNKYVICDVTAEGFGGFLRISPSQVRLVENNEAAVHAFYSIASPYDTVTVTNPQPGQEYVVSALAQISNEAVWTKAKTGADQILFTSYVKADGSEAKLAAGGLCYIHTRIARNGNVAAGSKTETTVVFLNAGKPSDMALDSDDEVIYVKKGKAVTLGVTYDPADAEAAGVMILNPTGQHVNSSFNEKKDSITFEGDSVGLTTVNICNNGYPPTSLKDIKVVCYEDEKYPVSVSFNEKEVSMTAGDRFTQSAVPYPVNVTVDGSWSVSGSTGVITIDETTGQVRAIGEGSAYAVFHYSDAYGYESSSSYTVTVTSEKTAEGHIHCFEEGAVIKEPTCTEPGTVQLECACGETAVSPIEPLGHASGEKYGYDERFHWQVCTECGEKLTAVPHEFSEEGVCSVCGYKENDHVCKTFELVPAEDATCAAEGHSAYYVCTECSRPFADAAGIAPIEDFEGLLIPKLPHTYGSDNICKVCGYDLNDLTGMPTPFTDVPAGAYYEKAVAWAYNSTPQITDGNGKDKFMPEQTCTRGQVVTFLWRSMGEPAPASTDNPFADVAETDYFYQPVLWAVEKKITDGTDAAHFSPANPCKNSHILTFIWRALGEPGKTEDAPTWYSDAYNWANYNQLLVGTYEGSYDVNALCPRRNVVEYLYRYYTAL